jgi:hypothetical protein
VLGPSRENPCESHVSSGAKQVREAFCFGGACALGSVSTRVVHCFLAMLVHADWFARPKLVVSFFVGDRKERQISALELYTHLPLLLPPAGETFTKHARVMPQCMSKMFVAVASSTLGIACRYLLLIIVESFREGFWLEFGFVWSLGFLLSQRNGMETLCHQNVCPTAHVCFS